MLAMTRWFHYLCLSLLITVAAHAETPELHAFVPGSYQQLASQNAKHPWVLIVWSITCPSCIKDMTLISELHKKYPALKLILLAADDLSATQQVQAILTKYGLSELENWVYADDNTQKLSYEIDPNWFGELPRTYFYTLAQQRTGVSGVIKQADFETMFAKITQAK